MQKARRATEPDRDERVFEGAIHAVKEFLYDDFSTGSGFEKNHRKRR